MTIRMGVCPVFNGCVTRTMRVGPVGCLCDQEDGCVTSRMGV